VTGANEVHDDEDEKRPNVSVVGSIATHRLGVGMSVIGAAAGTIPAMAAASAEILELLLTVETGRPLRN
jgi:hypothetical protein